MQPTPAHTSQQNHYIIASAIDSQRRQQYPLVSLHTASPHSTSRNPIFADSTLVGTNSKNDIRARLPLSNQLKSACPVARSERRTHVRIEWRGSGEAVRGQRWTGVESGSAVSRGLGDESAGCKHSMEL